MSLFSFLDKNNKEISVMFHIGSGSVGGYLVRFSKTSRPEIFYANNIPIPFQKNLNLERYFRLMIKTFDLVAQDVQKQGLLHLNFTGLRNYGIRNAFYILSSPWCVSQTKIIKIKKDKPFEMSIDLLERIVSEQEKKFLSDDLIDDSIIIEKKIIEAKLNGYRIADVYGKKTKEVELSFFLTSASESTLKELKNTAHRHFNFRSSYFHSFALSSFFAIRDIYPDKENFMYLDVHEELTDISIVKDNVFVESVSFPIGKNFFMRQLSEKLRVSVGEAYSLMNLYFSDKCNPTTSQKIQASINLPLKTWSDNFHSVLTSLSLNMYLPRTIFIMENDELGVFLVKRLKEEKFSQFSLTEESFDVIMLDNKKMSEYCKSAKNFKKELSAELECVFLNKVFNTK